MEQGEIFYLTGTARMGKVLRRIRLIAGYRS